MNRHASALTAVIILVLLAVIATLSWLLFLRAPQQTDVAPPPVPVQETPRPTATIGTVTAVRQAADLPTYILTDLGSGHGLALGQHLLVRRERRDVATIQIETLTEDGRGSACRVISADPPPEVRVGDTVTTR